MSSCRARLMFLSKVHFLHQERGNVDIKKFRPLGPVQMRRNFFLPIRNLEKEKSFTLSQKRQNSDSAANKAEVILKDYVHVNKHYI